MGRCIGVLVVLAVLVQGAVAGVSFEEEDGALRIRVDDRPFARYVYRDAQVLRPYFCDLYAANGVRVSRNHPPREGEDATDHADMHPGLWLAFGDVNGVDFWRNKGRVEQVAFETRPRAEGEAGAFAVRCRYVAPDGRTLGEMIGRYHIARQGEGVLLRIEAELWPGAEALRLGDQEEMGLGVRLATPLTVKQGGAIVNAEGGRDEAGVWGKASAWCVYRGGTGDGQAGVALMPHPENFRASWFHARDYGLLVANAFGRKAFGAGDTSEVRVEVGKALTLRYGVWVFAGEGVSVGEVYAGYVGAAR